MKKTRFLKGIRLTRPVLFRYDFVTLLFSGIVGFSQYCSENTDAEGAMKIINMLNELYTIFDALCDTKRIPNIFKVETVGDKYMAVSGLPETCDNHAKWIAKLALDMMDVAKNVRMGHEPVVSHFSNMWGIKLIFFSHQENHHRHPLGRGGYRSHWQPNAKVLSLRQHGQSD